MIVQDTLPKQVQPAVNRLRDKDYAEAVTKRGLCPKWMLANCRTMEREEASQRLRIDAKYGGIWLEGSNGFGQFRPRKEFKTSKSCKKALKYITAFGEDYDVMLPNNPHNRGYWDDLEALKGHCYIINSHPCLLLTEGMFTAIAPCSNDIPTIALAGVEQGLTPKKADPQEKRYLVPGLERFARAGFGFIIGFDADAATKKDVVMAQRKLAAQLSKFKCPTYSITGLWNTDEGKGIDDYIQMNGFDKFRDDVLAKAETIQKWEEQFKGRCDGDDDKPTQATVADAIIERYRQHLKWHTGNKLWCQYEAEVAGAWSEVTEEDVKAIVDEEARKQLGKNISDNFLNSTKNLLKTYLREKRWNVHKGYVCLQDCVVNLSTMQSEPHSPEFRFLHQLPFKWSDRGKGCQPIIDFLKFANSGHDDRVELLRAAFKATVTQQGASIQRFVEIVGSGGSGKGTVMTLVRRLVGVSAVAITNFKRLETNRFETANLFGKHAICITDAEQWTGDTSTFKSATGGDLLNNERKGIQALDPFVCEAFVWVAANFPISSNEYSSGLRRRRIPIPFNNSVKAKDKRNLEQEFEPYMAGFFFWVLGMPDHEMIAYLINTDDKVPSLRQHFLENLTETNPIADWIQTKVLIQKGAKTYVGSKTKDAAHYLYPSYCEYLLENGGTPLSIVKFSRVFVDVLVNQLRISDSVKDKDKYGAFITDVIIRQPGDIDIPFSFGAEESNVYNSNLSNKVTSGDQLVTSCDGLVDESQSSVYPSISTIKEKVMSCDELEPIQPPEKNSESVIRLTNSVNYPKEAKTCHQLITADESASQQEKQPIIPTHHPDAQLVTNPSPVTIYKENMTVYPLSGTYEGKECKVGTVDGQDIWVRLVTTQLGASPVCYQSSNLSFDAPIFEEEVSKYTQTNIFDLVPGEDCLEELEN